MDGIRHRMYKRATENGGLYADKMSLEAHKYLEVYEHVSKTGKIPPNQSVETWNNAILEYLEDDQRFIADKSEVDAEQARRFAHSIYMKKALCKFEQDPAVKAIFASIAQNVAAKIINAQRLVEKKPTR